MIYTKKKIKFDIRITFYKKYFPQNLDNFHFYFYWIFQELLNNSIEHSQSNNSNDWSALKTRKIKIL